MKQSIWIAFALAALCGFAMPEQASAQQVRLDWRDTNTTLGSTFIGLVAAPSSSGARAGYAKVVVGNTSTTVRMVECLLELVNTSVDVAQVTLAPGANATVALQVAGDPVAAEAMHVRCRVISQATNGVSVAWAKLTSMPVDSVTTQQD